MNPIFTIAKVIKVLFRQNTIHSNKIMLIAFLIMGSLAQQLFAKNKVRTVTVAYFQLEGYQEIGKGGIKSGYGYDFLCLLQRYSNLKFEYVGQDKSRAELIKEVENGKIDLITSIHKIPEHKDVFAFSYPIGVNAIIINTRNDNERLLPFDYQSFNNMTLGSLKGSLYNEHVKAFAIKNGFDYTPRYYDNLEELKEALWKKEVDAIATVSLRRMDNEKTLAQFDPKYFYAAVSKNDSSLLQEINKAITLMNQYEVNWQSRLLIRNYIQNNLSTLEFTPEERKFIKEHSSDDNPIILATDNNWKPFSIKNNGKYKGIIPDYWQKIFEMTGMKYRYYDSNDEVFDIAHLHNGDADIYLGTSYNEQTAETQNLLVSPTFMHLGASLLYMKTNPDIHTIAMSEITTFLNLTFKKENGWKVKYYKNTDEALKAIKDGEADAFYCYTYDAIRIENNDHNGLFSYHIVPDVRIALRAATSLDYDHTLISIISKCISRQGTDTEAIVSENLTFDANEFSLRDWIETNPILSAIIITFILILFITIWELYLRLRIRIALGHKKDSQLKRIETLNTQLKEAISQAENANRAKTVFLFNMSHDIRTPMNAIIGFADLIEKNYDNPQKCKDYLQKIQKSSAFLLTLINNVLEMARIDSGRIELNEVVCNTNLIPEEITTLYSDQLIQKNINLIIDVDFKAKYVYCDPLKLKEVFLNLISNAYKYTHSGGTITLVGRELPSKKPGYVLFKTTITDTGIGMSKDFLPIIFEEFTRERNSSGNHIQGTGLGMPIVKKLVDIMGGTIEVESELGVGTTFTITIPHRLAETPVEENTSANIVDTNKFVGKRILLAEDNDLNAEIAIEVLSEVGFVLERAINGAECVEMVRNANPGHYDLILMDIQMPIMNGYEATKAIRALDDKTKNQIPILAMTANAFEEDKANALKAGMNDHCSKPINIQELLKSLSAFI